MSFALIPYLLTPPLLPPPSPPPLTHTHTYRQYNTHDHNGNDNRGILQQFPVLQTSCHNHGYRLHRCHDNCSIFGAISSPVLCLLLPWQQKSEKEDTGRRDCCSRFKNWQFWKLWERLLRSHDTTRYVDD